MSPEVVEQSPPSLVRTGSVQLLVFGIAVTLESFLALDPSQTAMDITRVDSFQSQLGSAICVLCFETSIASDESQQQSNN
jgi:hypothetical protein